MSEEKKKTPRTLSRREFLRDAGIVVGGTAVGSAFILTSCGEEIEVTKTVTTTAPGGTVTKTTTVADDIVTKYICPVCSDEFDSLSDLQAHFNSVHEGQQSVKETIKLNVNGREYEVQVESNETMQEMLRNKLGFTSIKDMCFGWGACGACSILLNGRPVLSCMLLAGECDGAVIETAEGIADNGHPIIEGFNKAYAMQCGYCTPGFVVTAKALLDHNPNPTEADVREALGGNLCRCAAYPRMPIAVKYAADALKGGE